MKNTTTTTMTTDEQAEVLVALDRIRAAWDAGDADAYAAEFTEDASYVIFAGLHDLGQAAIRRAHIPVFGTWQRGSRMSMRMLDLRFIAPGVAVVLTEGGIGKGARIRHDKVQTFVMVRDGATWRCAAFQNTKKNRFFIAMNRRAIDRMPDARHD
ncbi:SgcJ/EcaC family oxidoreductase [Agromyces fucosus]|nr:SgcJ/EcaC family oxidoreductase [Agromyces fucosus]